MMKKILFFLILISVFLFIVLGFNYTRAADSPAYIKKELSSRFVKKIVIDGNKIYIGTAYKLDILNISDKSFKVVKVMKENTLPDTYITAIAYDSENIWVGTPSGLARVNKKTYQVRIYKKINYYITDLLVDGDQLWVATKQWGINTLDIKTGLWNNYSILQGLADNKVNCLAIDGQYIWAGTESGLSVYDKSIDFWKTYTVADGLAFPKITSLAVDGEYVWIGTMGGGLSRLNKLDDTFLTYTSDQGLIDENIQTLTLDGKLLWIGTFSGLNKYDKGKNKWESFSTTTGLPEDSVSTIAVNGNFLWVGTVGGGIVKMDKILPEAFISPLSHYSSPNIFEIIGTSYSYQNLSKIALDFRSEILNEYSKKGITLNKTIKVLNGQLGTINVQNLMNGTYYLRLTVEDKSGHKNVSYMPFIVDTLDPSISVDELPHALKTADIVVSGHYNEDNLIRVTVKAGQDIVPAQINRINHTFSANIVLRSGLNKLMIQADDIAGRKKIVEQDLIYDTDSPLFAMANSYSSPNPDFVIPGKVKDFAIKKVYLREKDTNVIVEPSKEEAYTYLFPTKVSLKQGENKFTFDAYDYVGNKTTQEVIVKFTSGRPIVTIDKSKLKVTKSEYVLKGTYSGNVKEIIITPGDIKASVDKTKKTFSAKISLQEGENVLTAMIYTKDQGKNFDIAKIIYSSSESKFALDKFNNYTSQKKVLLTGTFTEPKLKSIVLNPGKIRASVDFKNKSFQVYAPIKKVKNNFTLTMLDSDNVKSEKKFVIVKDDKSPEIKLDEIPAVVNVDKVTISGFYKEDHLDKININNTPATLNKEKNSFSLVVPLTPGKNDISISAIDKALNETVKDITVKFIPQFASTKQQVSTNEPSSGVSDAEVLKLKQEIARLRNQRVYVKKVSPTVAMPKSKAVFFAPFNQNLGDSLVSISRKYLGSDAYLPLISALNDNIDYASLLHRKSLLLPSKKMIEYLNRHNSFDPEVKIVNALTLSYNRLAKRKFSKEAYFQSILEYVINNESALSSSVEKSSSILRINDLALIVDNKDINFDYYRKLKKKKNIKKVIIGKIQKRKMVFYIL